MRSEAGVRFAAAALPTRTGEIQAVDRFELALRAQGEFRPGKPIQITVDVRGNLPTEDAELRVVLPEVEAAKRSSWDSSFSYRAGQPLPPAASRRRPLQRGASFTEQVTVTILAPGYYRVVATVVERGEPALVHNGRWIRNTAVRELWLLVTESGGTVTTFFDTLHVPEGMLKLPGPFRTGRRGDSGGQLDQSAGPDRPAADLAGSMLTEDMITYHVQYFNVESSAYEPVPHSLAVIRWCQKLPWQFICDEQSTWYEDSYYTNEQGDFMFPCNGDEYEGEATSYNGGARFVVYGGIAPTEGDVGTDCGGSFETVMPSNPARAFINMRLAINESETFFSAMRSFIVVNIVSDGSSYSPSEDEIDIDVGDVWDLGFQRGQFVVAHEYGHAFHEEALYGNEGAVCVPHFLDTNSSLGCAFSEGFADYFAAAVRPDLSPYHYRSYLENNDGFPGCAQRDPTEPYSCTGGPSSEGSLIESAFAAFLYDLTDAASESHDSIAAPGSYVRDVIRSCQVQYPIIGWRRANGTDEIVYCAENGISPGSYLTVRGAVPSAFSETATESGGWSATRVNANWHWNLYEKS